MALQGTLADFGIAEILQLIGTQQKTGVLHVEQEGGVEGPIQILFLGGKIIQCLVAHREKKDLIGNMLVAAEVVSSRDMERCLGLQRKQPEGSRPYIGDVLTKEGVVDRQTVDEFLMLQMREGLYRLFEFKDGRYRFESRPPNFAEASAGLLPAESVLMEGFRMLDEWPLIRTRIHNYDLVFKALKSLDDEENEAEALERVLDDAFSEFLDEPSLDNSMSRAPASGPSLGASERRVFSLIDSKRPVHRLIELSRLGEFETCKALVTLLNEGYIEATTQKAPQARPSRKGRRNNKALIQSLAFNGALLAILGAGIFLMPSIDDSSSLSADYNRRLRANRLRLVADALEVYAAEQGSYPPGLEQLVEAGLVQRDVLQLPREKPLNYVSIGTDYDLR